MILRNAWYVAAWGSEVGEETLLARTLLDEPIVLWRTHGRPIALADRCSHRGLPLSLGRVIDGVVECGYHGVCFDADGACVKIPGQGLPPYAIPVRCYPVIERYGFVWVWFGDAERADPDAIPDVHWAEDAGWVAARDRILVKAGHELLLENLNNHSHVEYVHAQVGSGGMSEADVRVRRFGDQVEIARWLLGRPAPPHLAKAGNFTGLVDRWFHGTFTPPTTIVLDLGCAPTGTGAPEGDRSQGIELRSLHLITPETETSTHYFWVYARSFALDDAGLTEQLRATATATFLEDLAILEAQQRALDRNGEQPFMNIAVDAGAITIDRLREEIAGRPLRTLSKV